VFPSEENVESSPGHAGHPEQLPDPAVPPPALAVGDFVLPSHAAFARSRIRFSLLMTLLVLAISDLTRSRARASVWANCC
jgi:hypothetical protein